MTNSRTSWTRPRGPGQPHYACTKPTDLSRSRPTTSKLISLQHIHSAIVSPVLSKTILARDQQWRAAIPLALVVVASAANAINYGSYSEVGVILLCAGLVAIRLGLPLTSNGSPDGRTFVAAVEILGLLNLAPSLAQFAGEAPSYPIWILALTIATLALLSEKQWVRWPALAIAITADLLVILSKIRWGKATIDVFGVLQHGDEHLLHLQNPYTYRYVSTTPGQAYTHFPYGPGAIAATLPGRIAGDVRLPELLMMALLILAITATAKRTVNSRYAWALLALMLACPFTMFMIVQSWVEVIPMAGIAVWLWIRDRWPTISIGALGLGLSASFLPLPLLAYLCLWHRRYRLEAAFAIAVAIVITAPFLLWTGPVHYLDDVLLSPLSLPWRRDALGLNPVWADLTGGPLPWPLALGLPALIGASLLRAARRGVADALMAGTLLVLGALLVTKFAFFNYYFIVVFGALIAMSQGFGLQHSASRPRDPSTLTTGFSPPMRPLDGTPVTSNGG